jgi:hypothetical protein
MSMLAEFIVKSVTGITSPVTNRASSLNDKGGGFTDDSVKCKTIIKPIAGQEHEIVHYHRNIATYG